MESVSEAFALICELGTARGYKNLHKTEGCWKQDIDDNWRVRLNPHSEKCEELSPFSCEVQYNEFPVGVVAPYGGCLIGAYRHDDESAEDALIDALNKAIAVEVD